MRLEIYGCSDDLLEIEGDLREEFNVDAWARKPNYLMFSDGTVLKYWYDGEWTFKNYVQGKNSTSIAFFPCEQNKHCEYSELVIVEGDFKWVANATNLVKAK